MRNVLKNHSEVCHFWANKTQESGRASRIFFEGDRLYSYGHHFEIARHATGANGESAVLFSERKYSNSTAKHQNYAWHAARHLRMIDVYRSDWGPADNFKHMEGQAKDLVSELNGRARDKEARVNALGRIRAKAQEYAEFLGIDVPASLIELLDVADDPKWQEMIEARAKRQAELDATRPERRAKLDEAREKEYAAAIAEALQKWEAGEGYRLNLPGRRHGRGYWYSGKHQDYLRVHDGRIQTSQAVELPLELGRRLWERVKAGTLAIGDVVLGYTVGAVGEEIKIGCHRFPASYLIEFGQKIFA